MAPKKPISATKSKGKKPRPAKIAILSDLHACMSSSKTSFLCADIPEEPPTQHPVSALLAMLQAEHIKADYLVCPGDMSDKAQPPATIYAWTQLNRIAKQLGAQIVATAGNHDVDSRYQYNDFDAKGVLQGLAPPFPLWREPLNDRFWSRNFVLYSKAPYRFLVINSSAYHGAGSSESPEHQHGRISQATIAAIRKELTTAPAATLNIAVCHHHPFRIEGPGTPDESEMAGGTLLMNLFDSGQFGRWLVIHGHRHHGTLTYSAGSSQAPIIFGAGSFAAFPYQNQLGSARNQFYIMEFPHATYSELELELAGTLTAWDWSDGVGWQSASSDSTIPALAGFGHREDLEYLGTKLRAHIKSLIKKTKSFVAWDAVLDTFRKVPYLVPKDLAGLCKVLTQKGVTIYRNEKGHIIQVGIG